MLGGDGGDRTHDLLNAIQALSQLSYAPECLYSNIINTKMQEFFKNNAPERGLVLWFEKYISFVTMFVNIKYQTDANVKT